MSLLPSFPESPAASTTSFAQFQHVCARLQSESSRNAKSVIIGSVIGLAEHPDIDLDEVELWCRLLLTKFDFRTYNLGRKQMTKLAAALLEDVDAATLQEAYDHHETHAGDLPMVIATAFQQQQKQTANDAAAPPPLLLRDIDELLDAISEAHSLVEKQALIQARFLDKVAGVAGREDEANVAVLVFFRLLSKDLKISCGAPATLSGVHPDASAIFKANSNIKQVLAQCRARMMAQNNDEGNGNATAATSKSKKRNTPDSAAADEGKGKGDASSKEAKAKKKPKKEKQLPVVKVGAAFRPMLAGTVKEYDVAVKRCKGNTIFIETKYDGHRCLSHVQPSHITYFSRTCKPTKAESREHIDEYLPRALSASVRTVVFDGEVLLMNLETGVPFPMSEMGKHSREKYSDDEAAMCYVLFDVLSVNGESLLEWPLERRRAKMEEIVTPIENRIVFSTLTRGTTAQDIEDVMEECMDEGLEGLMLKNSQSKYVPNQRGWLKMKIDYLEDGAMADSADLVVLAGKMGKGRRGGLLSSFLMGTYDKETEQWLTVTRMANGFTAEALRAMQADLFAGMNPVGVVAGKKQLPPWLKVSRKNEPDYVAKDPWKSPVWEIAGAQFTRSKDHTANGISIRFPKLVRVRDDKDAKSATNLEELCDLCLASGQTDPRLVEILKKQKQKQEQD